MEEIARGIGFFIFAAGALFFLYYFLMKVKDKVIEIYEVLFVYNLPLTIVIAVLSLIIAIFLITSGY